MRQKRSLLSLAVLLLMPTLLLAGTYRPKDGILSFLILLGFLVILLGIIHLADLLRSALRTLQKELNFEDLF